MRGHGARATRPGGGARHESERLWRARSAGKLASVPVCHTTGTEPESLLAARALAFSFMSFMSSLSCLSCHSDLMAGAQGAWGRRDRSTVSFTAPSSPWMPSALGSDTSGIASTPPSPPFSLSVRHTRRHTHRPNAVL